jgi:6-phosphogluconolactonase
MNNMQRFCDRKALDTALAEHIADSLRRDLAWRGAASLAVSGGSTPRGMFTRLALEELDWSQVHVTLVDERWVSTDSPDSNERLVRETLLQGPAAAARFIGLKTEHDHASDALEGVSARLSSIPLPFTCVVLGMGNDGHTASWFAQATNLQHLLDASSNKLLGSCDPVTAPHQRITLTLPAVLAAGEIILHITGDDKRETLAEAVDKHYPIAAVTGQQINPVSIWWAP